MARTPFLFLSANFLVILTQREWKDSERENIFKASNDGEKFQMQF